MTPEQLIVQKFFYRGQVAALEKVRDVIDRALTTAQGEAEWAQQQLAELAEKQTEGKNPPCPTAEGN
ncbi:hypothetical protein [Trichloromonas sp.]|uniref:hypothetical protein n=1 Tax=Trichloromonas sp. TaxID=3069249 RepID=UPI002A4D2DB6|nr:hypothetical protein [Trichloromonas sp.]